MPSVAGFCSSFMRELLCAVHAFGTGVARSGSKDELKLALYTSVSELTPGETTTYTTSNEVVGTGYTAGGIVLENANEPDKTTTKAFWSPSGTASWSDATLSDVATVLLYNATQETRAVGIWNMTPRSIVAGVLTITFPSHTASSGLIQVA